MNEYYCWIKLSDFEFISCEPIDDASIGLTLKLTNSCASLPIVIFELYVPSSNFLLLNSVSDARRLSALN